MIATHAHCGSPICKHKEPHAKNEFCGDGQCRWSKECRCVPENRREQVIAILDRYMYRDERIANIADAIESVYKEAL